MPGRANEGKFLGIFLMQGSQLVFMLAPVLVAGAVLPAQEPPNPQGQPVSGAPVTAAAPTTSLPSLTGTEGGSIKSPIAIVPLESSAASAAASVTGPIQAANGSAFITSSGEIAANSGTVRVTLPYRGTMNVCANTNVKLSVDTSVPPSQVPGLLIGLDSGALEASFAIVKDSDIVQTPDFRILISGPGAADVKVRLGPKGDTCVDNPDANGSYVLVSSVFGGGVYRVQPGQRVMFQHGNLHEVVDDEKEPCGCPPPVANGNEFPLAQSEGLAPAPKATPPAAVNKPAQKQAQDVPPLVYMGSDQVAKNTPGASSPAKPETAAPLESPPAPAPAQNKPGFFKRVGHFFGRIFGAEG